MRTIRGLVAYISIMQMHTFSFLKKATIYTNIILDFNEIEIKCSDFVLLFRDLN